MNKFSIFLGFVGLFVFVNSFAQEEETRSPDSIPALSAPQLNPEKIPVLQPGIVEKTYEGSTDIEGASQARRKIIDEAMFKVSEQLIQSILGETRFRKNKTIIVDKVFRQASRFIPVIKTGELVKTPEGQKLEVTLQVNTKLLETILQEQGLLYDNESAPMLIPFVAIEDQVHGDNFRWWKAQNPTHLHGMGEFLENQLQKTFFDLGFFVQRPDASQMRMMMPIAYQQEILTPEQVQGLANRWSIPLAMVGDLTIRKDTSGDVVFDLHLSVNQVSTGRVLAQLYRQKKLSPKENLEALNLKRSLSFVVLAFRDLAQQMLDAWQRGVLTSSLVRLEVQGLLPLNRYELFKDALKASNRSIRQVRERMISSKSVLFELEINGAVSELTSSLGQVVAGDRTYRFKGFDGPNTLIMIPSGISK